MKSMFAAVVAVFFVAGPAAQAATEPNPSAKQRELTLEVLRLTKSDQLASSVMDAFFAQMQKSVADSEKAGEQAKADAAQMFTRIRELAAKLDFSDIQEEQIRLYARYFDENDLAQMVTFYQSPTGQKQIAALPALTRDGMKLGAEKIAPKIEAIIEQARMDLERSRPWRGTMDSMESIGIALDVYAGDHDGRYPRALSFAALLEELDDEELASKDVWENAFAYVVSADARHYRLISSGADANFEFDSRTIVPAKEGEAVATRYRERLEDDIIYADGEFVQLPKLAAPKQRPEPK